MNAIQSKSTISQAEKKCKCPFCADGMISPRDMRRFWSRVNKLGPTPDQSVHHYKGLSNCWDWTAAKDKDGYGNFHHGGAADKSHRLSFKIHKDSIAKGMFVMHLCDRPSCVNPDHLRLGTSLENNLDMKSKGRTAHGDRHGRRKNPECTQKGSDHPNSKLTEEQVREIRASKEPGPIIARRYKLNRNTPNLIRSMKSWRHVR